MKSRKDIVVGLGGTFDHLHQGHKDFIKFAAQQGTALSIGVTHSSMTRYKKLSHLIQPYQVRAHAVKQFCKKNRIKATVTQINDIYGPTINNEQPTISKLAVTTETTHGAQKINEVRKALGLFELSVHVCPLTKDSQGNDLHSEAIRAGLVARDGFVYSQLFTQTLHLTLDQRSYLQKPLGQLLSVAKVVESMNELKQNNSIILVGDITTQTFLENDLPFDLAFYDGISQRKQIVKYPKLEKLKTLFTVNNDAGSISTELAKQVKSYFSQPTVNPERVLGKVNGEEDLSMIVVNLLAPFETSIYYGQPNQGLVQVIVTEQNKEKLRQLLST